MASDRMKEMTTDIFNALAADDIERAMESFADDATWFSHGRMPAGLSGHRSGKGAIVQYLEKLSRAFVNRRREITIAHIYREGQVVICEVHIAGKLRNDKNYENEYGYVIDFLNGRVQQVREYFNSLVAAEAFAGLLWPMPGLSRGRQ
jgi:ketosteroid isomerase-like protein